MRVNILGLSKRCSLARPGKRSELQLLEILQQNALCKSSSQVELIPFVSLLGSGWRALGCCVQLSFPL